MNLAVFVSGGGSNLQRIFEAINSQELINTKVKIVIADRECPAIDRAKKNKVEYIYTLSRGKNLSKDIDNLIKDKNIDLIVLAGYLSIISKEFCDKWENKIINIHPSLLPKYGGKGMYGENVHKAVLNSGDKISGATVHYVTNEIDGGKIILQKTFDINIGDKVSDLQNKVHKVEQQILIEAINKINNES